MEAKKEEKCETEGSKKTEVLDAAADILSPDRKKQTYIKSPPIPLQDSEWDSGNSMAVGMQVDIHFMAFQVKAFRIFIEQYLKHKDVDKAEIITMDTLVKFFQENKGKPFSDFTKVTQNNTADNMVAK